jgi:hypothetical protein
VKAVLRLELIADDAYRFLRTATPERISRVPFRQYVRALRDTQHGMRPWVARITGERIAPQLTDYSEANSVGSRGVYAYYTLDDGVYEINDRVSWQRARRYFLRVQDGQKTEITREEGRRCRLNTTQNTDG